MLTGGVALAGCNSAFESESQVEPGADGEAVASTVVQPRSQARAGGDLPTMLSEVVGRGAPVDDAACLALNIDLELADDGTPVPSPSEDGPLVVAQDDPRLIAGLRLGLDGMAVDGRRSMLIPPSLGYGDAGWGNGLVSSDDTLRADVSVLWAGSRPSWTWDELHRAAHMRGDALDLEKGHGAPLADDAKSVVMIDAVDLDGRTTVASMWDGCDAHGIDLGANDLSGWFVDELDGLRPGGTRLVLPPDGAHHDDGTVDAWVVTLAMTQD